MQGLNGGFFCGDGRPEKDQGAVAPQFVYHAFVFVDPVDDNFENLIHKRKGSLRPDLSGQGRKTFHIAEHDGYIAQLSVGPFHLGEDFSGEGLGCVLLKTMGVQLRWDRRCGAVGKRNKELTAFIAEFGTRWIVELAARAFHCRDLV
jgi:hypothetical protein